MGGEHHRDAVGAQLAHEVPGGAAGLWVQARGRLVEEDEFGPADDGHREREALLLAAGEPAVGGAAATIEPQALDERVHVERVGVQLGHVAQHLVGAGAGVDAAGLEHDADARLEARGVGDRVEAEDADGAGVGPAVALARLDGGGLAGAVGAEDGGHGGGADREVEAVHGGFRSVPLDQAHDLDDGLAVHDRQV